jgi:sortase A
MRIVGYVGRALLATGVLILAFVAYQLWGTGLHEAQAQNELSDQFEAMLAGESPTTTSSDPSGPGSTLPVEVAPTKDLAVAVGDPIGRLDIPKLHVDKIVVQGVPLIELDRAPGHYPQTPFPGQAGNSAIAGHRTTYGAPFYNIDKLKPGDEIHIKTLQGSFTYKMIWSKIVKPDAMWVLDTDPDHPNTLTLTACHPRLDLTERYIVRAVLVGNPAPRLPGQDAAMKNYAAHSDALADGVTAASHPGAWPQLLLWAAICAAIWLVVWWASRRWRRIEHRQPPRWIRAVVPYVVGVPVFGVALFFAFENLSNIVPAGL